jgi:hypothetical protein
MKIIKISFLFLFAIVFFIRCSTLPPVKNSDLNKNFEKIKIGDDVESIKSVWGITETNDEIYLNVKYEALAYHKSDGKPGVIFTLDPSSQRVVSKLLWVYPNDKYYNLSNVKMKIFNGLDFEKFVPCNTRSEGDKILVNRNNGIYIATESENIVLISWATPQLINHRINLILKKCPELQPKPK